MIHATGTQDIIDTILIAANHEAFTVDVERKTENSGVVRISEPEGEILSVEYCDSSDVGKVRLISNPPVFDSALPDNDLTKSITGRRFEDIQPTAMRSITAFLANFR